MKSIPLGELLRLERSELDNDTANQLREKLKSDPEAATWLAWIESLRAGARAPAHGEGPGAPHGPEAATFGEIARLAAGFLDAAEAAQVREKLLLTPDGYDLLESALEEVSSLSSAHQGDAPPESLPPILPGPHRGPQDRRPGGSPTAPARGIPRAILAVAAAALVATLLWVWQRPPSGGGAPERSVAILAERTPMSVPRLRSGTFEAGLKAYEMRDFSGAAALLRAAAESEAAAGTIWLYLGSCELLLGNLEEAGVALTVARKKCEPSYQVEATWQLAQTRLAQDLPGEAAQLLSELAGTRRDEAAKAKLEELGQLAPTAHDVK